MVSGHQQGLPGQPQQLHAQEDGGRDQEQQGHDQILVKVMLVCNKTEFFYYRRFFMAEIGLFFGGFCLAKAHFLDLNVVQPRFFAVLTYS